MSLTKTKLQLLDEFEVIARRAYGEKDVPAEVRRLLNDLVALGLDDMEVGRKTSLDDGVVYLIGQVECEQVSEDAGVLDQMFQVHLNLPVEKPLTLFISSGGGDVEAGLAVVGAINEIRRQGRKVHAHVAGWAMSMAFDIVQHCDRRTMEPTAFLMIHEENFASEGSTSKHKTETEFSEHENRLLLEALSSRTGKPVSYYVGKTRNRDWYVSPEEAVAEGMIDEIMVRAPLPKVSVAPPAPRAPRRARKTPQHKGVITVTEGSEAPPPPPTTPSASTPASSDNAG